MDLLTRVNAVYPGLPIVVMTAHAYGSVGKRAVAAGCDGFLSKPVSRATLAHMLRTWTSLSAE